MLGFPLGAFHAPLRRLLVIECHVGKDWFSSDLFMALMRTRGMECRAPSGYAEAFNGRKLRLTA